MGYETYAGWAGVAIDGGFESGSEGFGFAERGLVSREEGFDGWLGEFMSSSVEGRLCADLMAG